VLKHNGADYVLVDRGGVLERDRDDCSRDTDAGGVLRHVNANFFFLLFSLWCANPGPAWVEHGAKLREGRALANAVGSRGGQIMYAVLAAGGHVRRRHGAVTFAAPFLLPRIDGSRTAAQPVEDAERLALEFGAVMVAATGELAAELLDDHVHGDAVFPERA